MAIDAGHIEIVAGATDQGKIEITRRVHADDEAQAKSLLANHVVEAKSEGGSLNVKAEMKKEFQESKERNRFKQIKFVVTIPREYNLDLHTSGGHITVPDMKSEITPATSGGHVAL